MTPIKPISKQAVAIILIVLAAITLSVFSFTTSPLYKEPCAWDSAIFQIIGKAWSEGVLPYVGLWDLKGPIIFFINAIGYALTGSRTGVFLLQWVSLSATLIILCRLVCNSHRDLLCPTVIFSLFSFGANILGGNTVEEYLLPLLALSYAFIYRWLEQAERSPEHPPRWAVAYGLVLGFSLLTRLSNGLGICMAVAIIAVWIARHGRWRNLLHNVAAFAAGFAAVVLPFLLYFWAKDATADMWYGTIFYNLDYAGTVSPDIKSYVEVAKSMVYYADTWLLLATSILMLLLKSRRRMAVVMWMGVAMVNLLWLLRGYQFSHYAITSLPLVAISLMELTDLCHEKADGRTFHRAAAIIVVYAIVISGALIHAIRLTKNYHYDDRLTTFRSMINGLPQGYKQSFAAYNCPANWYLYEDIRPKVRFFAFQDFEAEQSLTYRRYLQEDFRRLPEWVLVNEKAREIDGILRQNYHVWKTDKAAGLTLYRANNPSIEE